MYYGYRCGGRDAVDPRIGLMRRDWFEGKECLDIGCNTGQVCMYVHSECGMLLLVLLHGKMCAFIPALLD